MEKFSKKAEQFANDWRDPKQRAFRRFTRFFGLKKLLYLSAFIQLWGVFFFMNTLFSLPLMLESWFPYGLLGETKWHWDWLWLITLPPFNRFLFVYFIALIALNVLLWRRVYTKFWSNASIEETYNQATSRMATDEEVATEHVSLSTDDDCYTGACGFSIGTRVRTKAEERTGHVREILATEPSSILTFGLTGIGKGIFSVEHDIDTLSRTRDLAEKGSMIIHDPSGELYAKFRKILDQRSYTVKLLNLAQTFESETFNPLQMVVESYKDYLFAEKTIDREKGKESADSYLSALTHSFFHDEQAREKFWQDNAGLLFQGATLAMIEEALLKGKEELCNIYTIVSLIENMNADRITYEKHPIFEQLTKDTLNQEEKKEQQAVLFQKYKDKTALDVYFSELPQGHFAKEKYTAILASAPATGTIGNIVTHLITKMAPYKRPGNARMTSENSIEILNLAVDKQPMAIFLVVSDQDKTNHPIASNFIDQTFKILANHAMNKCVGRKLPRRVYFLCEEFGNMPAITDIGTKVTDSRKFNMFWSFVIQNLEQLDKYSEAERLTILYNCGYIRYHKSPSNRTNELIVELLGKRMVSTLSRNGQVLDSKRTITEGTERIEQITKDELTRLQYGEMLSFRMIKTHDLEREAKTFYPIFSTRKNNSHMLESYKYLPFENEDLVKEQIKAEFADKDYTEKDMNQLLYTLDVTEIPRKNARLEARKTGTDFEAFQQEKEQMQEKEKQRLEKIRQLAHKEVVERKQRRLASIGIKDSDVPQDIQIRSSKAEMNNSTFDRFHSLMETLFGVEKEIYSTTTVLSNELLRILNAEIRGGLGDLRKLEEYQYILEKKTFKDWKNWLCDVGGEECIMRLEPRLAQLLEKRNE